MATVTTGWYSPGTAANVDRDGKAAWSNVDNAKTDDGDEAEVDVVKSTYSDWIRLTNFGISLPSDAVITGIELWVNHNCEYDNAGDTSDSAIYLRKTSGQVGDDKADTSTDWYTSGYPPVWNTVYYGASDDDWNASLTQADVVSSDFGIDISAQNTVITFSRKAYVFYVAIRITYTTDLVVSGSPGTAANVDRDSKTSWSNTDNVKTDDANYATNTPAKNTYGDWLTCTNFGFTSSDIPVGATIDGIILTVRKFGATSIGKYIQDSAIYLLDGDGAQQGDNKASATNWSLDKETVTYGAIDDDWNAGLTQADVIDSDFGVKISVTNDGSAVNAYIYYVEIAIYITIPTADDTGYRLYYRKSGTTYSGIIYDADVFDNDHSVPTYINGAAGFLAADSNTSHANASDLRIRDGGTTYAILTEKE